MFLPTKNDDVNFYIKVGDDTSKEVNSGNIYVQFCKLSNESKT